MSTSGSIKRAQVPIRDKGSSQCQNHPKSNVLYVCIEETCKGGLACTECVTSIHQGHKFVKLEDFIERKKANIRSDIEYIQKNGQQELLNEIQDVNVKLSENRSKSVFLASTLKDQGGKFKKVIDEAVESMTRSCAIVFQENTKILSEHKCKLVTEKDKTDESLQYVTDIVENGSDISVYNLPENFPLNDISLSNRPALKNMVYIPNQIPSEDTIKEMLCSINADEGLGKRTYVHTTNPVLVPMSVFQIEGLSVMYATSDGHCISWKGEQNYLCLMTNKGKLKKKININSVKPRAITLSQEDIVWLLCEDNSIRIITSMDSVIKLFDIVTENPIHDLCITRENNVLVASDRNFTLYNRQGGRHYTADFVGSGEPVIKSFAAMDICRKNGLLVVLDDDNGNDNPGIVAFNSDLTFRFRFSDSGERPFAPSLFTFDGNGNVLVPNQATQSVMMISPDGLYIKTLYQMDPMCFPMQTMLRNNVFWLTIAKNKKRLFKSSITDMTLVKCFRYDT